MANFAKIRKSDNIVLGIEHINNAVIENLPFPESENLGIIFITSLPSYSNNNEIYWKQTSFNGNFRKRQAVVGAKYDPELDAFLYVKPANSWTLNTQTIMWEAPTPPPGNAISDGHGTALNPNNIEEFYVWHEDTLSWKTPQQIVALLPQE